MHIASLKEVVSAEEWQLRCDLAACYRLVAAYGWSDLVFTHVSARIPGPEHHFLINPYGLMFDEITASSLVKVDQDCNKLQRLAVPGQSGRLRHPQCHPCGARRCRLRAAHAFARRRGGQRAEVRRAADQPAVHLRAALAGLSRLRRRGVARRREGAPAGRPGARQLPDAAQPRPADGGPHHRRRVHEHVHLREHLPHPDRRAGRWRTDTSRIRPSCRARPRSAGR